MTTEQTKALLTALRAQIDPRTGHTFDCGHTKQTWGGVVCIGQCSILREALSLADDDGEANE